MVCVCVYACVYVCVRERQRRRMCEQEDSPDRPHPFPVIYKVFDLSIEQAGNGIEAH